MPTPIGHVLAGLTVALAADQRRQASIRWPRLAVICAMLAASPDLDLLYPGGHRMLTHSFFAVGLVWLASMGITRARGGRVDWRVTMACTLAYGSHLLIDYFGWDPGTPAGLQLLWPWSGEWFMSDWSLFRSTERHSPFSTFAITMNVLALAQELLLLGPMLLIVWMRRRRLERERPYAAARINPAQAAPPKLPRRDRASST